MKKNIILFITMVSVFSFNCFAQMTKVSLTEDTQIKYVYVDVIKTYERMAEKGFKSIDMFKKMGDSYYSNFELDKAAKWYGELFDMTSDLEPEYYYRYAQSLESVGQIDKANETLEIFNQKSENFFQKQRQNDNPKILLKNNHHEK